MPFPQLLVTKCRKDASTSEEAAVYVMESPSQLRQLGDSFGASTIEAHSANHYRPSNRAIRFRGKVYAWVRNVIREFDPSTEAWSVSHTVSDQLSTEGYAYHTGFYFAVLEGVPTIFGAYQTASSTAKIVKFDGATWSEVGGTLSTSSHGHWGPAFLWRNRLWIPTSINGTARHVSMDPTTGSGATFTTDSTSESNSRVSGSYVTFKNRLLGVFMTNPGNRTLVLFEYQAGGWVTLQNLQAGVAQSVENHVGGFAWATEAAVYVWYSYVPISDRVQFKLVKLTPTGSGEVLGETFSVTDLSNPVVPASMRSAHGVYPNFYKGVSGYVDYGDPVSPRVFLWILQQPGWSNGYPTHVMEFVDDATEMTTLGVGPSTAVAVPHTSFAAGEYTWSPRFDIAKIEVIVESLSVIDDAYVVSFRVHGGDGLTARSVTLYFALEEGLPMTRCDLVAATATGGSASNTTERVTGINDDGSILYSVEWSAATQGVTAAARPVMAGIVE